MEHLKTNTVYSKSHSLKKSTQEIQFRYSYFFIVTNQTIAFNLHDKGYY